MSDVERILDQADMATPRTPRALCDWVNSKAAEFSTTAEGKRFARSGKLLPKKLWEEVRPLGLFALRKFGSGNDARCIPNLGNQNYDARIEFSDASTMFVEVTYAKDGHDESMRLEVLSKTGSVNVLGAISKSGTKASGRKIAVADEAVEHQVTRSKALCLVRERIVGKSNKSYGRSHILLVVVDDYLAFRTEDDRAVLQQFAKSVVDDVSLDFSGVFLLGASGDYLHAVREEI